MRFEGKVVLITGGARGIGAATAGRFAREGAKVAVTDLDFDESPDGILQIRCDVTKRDDVEAAVEAAAQRGSLDILVTCAGIIRDNMLFKMTDEDWDAVVQTHLKGSFLAARAAQRHMVEQRSGKIILISSTSALGNRGQTNYSAAKAGIQGMTKTLAIELGPFNVNVNCVAPGFIATDMVAAVPEKVLEKITARIPLQRLGRPEEIARVVEFLAEDGSAYITGQVFGVNGGLEM